MYIHMYIQMTYMYTYTHKLAHCLAQVKHSMVAILLIASDSQIQTEFIW